MLIALRMIIDLDAEVRRLHALQNNIFLNSHAMDEYGEVTTGIAKAVSTAMRALEAIYDLEQGEVYDVIPPKGRSKYYTIRMK